MRAFSRSKACAWALHCPSLVAVSEVERVSGTQESTAAVGRSEESSFFFFFFFGIFLKRVAALAENPMGRVASGYMIKETAP